MVTEKFEIELSTEKTPKTEAMTTVVSPEVNPTSEKPCFKKIKPRAIIFKANDKDFSKLKDSIKSQFPDVEIVYVTTGPVSSILRVTKSIPFELQDSSEQTNYTVE
jgi:hypothetical protein